MGRVVAHTLGQQGAYLLLIDKHLEDSTDVPGDSDHTLQGKADLLDAGQLLSLVNAAAARWGRVDILCHLAGGFRMGPAVHETSAQDWQFLMDTNAVGLINIANAVVPLMIKQSRGHIVTVGAAAAARGKASMGAYCASKSSVMRLTESMSAELQEKNIQVNCVLPSVIDTPANRAAMPDADPSSWVQPQALADVIAFLCSDKARAIHGAAIPVTGRTLA